MPYKVVKLNISAAKQKKALKGGSIRLNKDDIGQGSDVYLHPQNAAKVLKAKNGVNLTLSPGEMMFTAQKSGILPKPSSEDLEGSGFFDKVWDGLKKIGSFLKDSGVGTAVLDALVPAAGVALGNPAIATAGRSIVKNLTGVGINTSTKKRSYKKKMAGSGLYI